MVAMSKDEVVKYLYDMSNFRYVSMHHQNVPFAVLFQQMMNGNNRSEDATENYYLVMMRVYVIYSAMKYFSICEDYLLNQDNLVDNAALGLDSLKKSIVKSGNVGNISDKNLIMYIRNAFNHNNDDEHDKFCISPNGKNIEINLKDIRSDSEKAQPGSVPRPFVAKLSINDLITITNSLQKAKRGILAMSFNGEDEFDPNANDMYREFEKIISKHYYFKGKMDTSDIQSFDKIVKMDDKTTALEAKKKSEDFNNLANSISNSTFKETRLDDEQIQRAMVLLKKFRSSYSERILRDEKAMVISQILDKVLPIPGYKLDLYNYEIVMSATVFNNYDLCYEDVLRRVYNIYYQRTDADYSDHDIKIHNKLSEIYATNNQRLELHMETSDGENFQLNPMLALMDYVICTYCTDDKIKIGAKYYDREHIRNAFTHGRWYLANNKEIVMYDAAVKNSEDLNFDWKCKFKLEDMLQFVNGYIEKKLLKKDEKVK